MVFNIITKIKKRYKAHSDEAGFTLLETLIAFIILSFSIGAALQVLSLNSKKITRATAYTNVIELIQEIKMKIFLSDNFERDISGSTDTGLNWQAKPILSSSKNGVQVFSIEIKNKNSSSINYKFLHSKNNEVDQ